MKGDYFMGKIIFKVLGWTFGTYAVVNTAAICWLYWGHLCEESSNRLTVDEAADTSTVLQTDVEILEEDFANSLKWTGLARDSLKKAFSR